MKKLINFSNKTNSNKEFTSNQIEANVYFIYVLCMEQTFYVFSQSSIYFRSIRRKKITKKYSLTNGAKKASQNETH